MPCRTGSIAVLLLAAATAAQATCPLVIDLDPRVRFTASSSPSSARGGPDAHLGAARLGSYWYFTAETRAAGRELWRTDGTAAGTQLFADLQPGTESSTPLDLYVHKGRLYFSCEPTSTGRELWISDGTAAGTRLLKDIAPGQVSSDPDDFVPLGNALLFSAEDGNTGRELWISDGTGAGTLRLKDIRGGSIGGDPRYLTLAPNGLQVFFQANDGTAGPELWTSDGTATGTVLVADIRPGAAGSDPQQLVPFGGGVLFSALDNGKGRELWFSDGTPAGTRLVKDIEPGTASSSPRLTSYRLATLGSRFYFSAFTSQHGRELWYSDGTSAGTQLLQDLRPGSASSDPGPIHTFNNVLYFGATDANGTSLWRHDSMGTGIIRTPALGGPRDVVGMYPLGAKLLLHARPRGVNQLWITDGSATGTQEISLQQSPTPGGNPALVIPLSSSLALLRAHTSLHGAEAWITDGTVSGTQLLKDLNTSGSTWSSDPGALFAGPDSSVLVGATQQVMVQGTLTALDRLLRVDGTQSTVLADVRVPHSQSARGFDGQREFVVFAGQTSQHGYEPWVTDGTPAGTHLLKEIAPGPTAYSNPQRFLAMGNKVYFVAAAVGLVDELWCTDGTTAGTVQLTQLGTSSQGASPRNLTPFRGLLYFAATEQARGGTGREIFVTDGTPAGTRLAIDMHNPGGSDIEHLQRIGDQLVFTADLPMMNREFFVSDGTRAGTRLIKSVTPPLYATGPMQLTVVDDLLFFVLHDGVHGEELWVSDLTAAGTRMVVDLVAGSVGSRPRDLFAVDGKLLFSAGPRGEFWVSDGTAKGTVKVQTTGSDPLPRRDVQEMVRAGQGVYCRTGSLSNPTRQLFAIDVHLARSRLLCARDGLNLPNPGQTCMLAAGKHIYLIARNDEIGMELFRFGGSPALVDELGAHCGAWTPRLQSDLPRLGSSIRIRCTNAPPTGPRLLAFGRAGTPLQLAGLVAPGCASWLDLSGPLLLQALPIQGSFSVPITIPNNTSLLGAGIRTQAVFDPLPLTFSTALHLYAGE